MTSQHFTTAVKSDDVQFRKPSTTELAIRTAEYVLRQAGVSRENHVSRIVTLERDRAEIGLALDLCACALGVDRWDRESSLADYIEHTLYEAIQEGKGLE